MKTIWPALWSVVAIGEVIAAFHYHHTIFIKYAVVAGGFVAWNVVRDRVASERKERYAGVLALRAARMKGAL